MTQEPLSPEQIELLRYLPSVGGGSIGFRPNEKEYKILRRDLVGFNMNDGNRFWRTYEGDVLLATIDSAIEAERDRVNELAAEVAERITYDPKEYAVLGDGKFTFFDFYWEGHDKPFLEALESAAANTSPDPQEQEGATGE